MFKENTDNYAVLSHLIRYKSINDWYALNTLGVKRLSARIDEIRKAGYKIKTIFKTVVKRSGRKTRVCEKYVIVNKNPLQNK